MDIDILLEMRNGRGGNDSTPVSIEFPERCGHGIKQARGSGLLKEDRANAG
jgi:hypothetical protein